MPIRLLHIWRLLRQGDEKEWAGDFGMDDASKGHARASIDPRLVDRSRRRGVRPSGFVAANQDEKIKRSSSSRSLDRWTVLGRDAQRRAGAGGLSADYSMMRRYARWRNLAICDR